mgnify:CR=1 FL=1
MADDINELKRQNEIMRTVLKEIVGNYSPADSVDDLASLNRARAKLALEGLDKTSVAAATIADCERANASTSIQD